MKTTLPLRSFAKSFKISAFLAVFFFPFIAQAQCPMPASCTPGNPPSGNVAFGMGILNVNVNNGAINNTTAAVTATSGYVDYSCLVGTTLSPGIAYPISIQTNPNVNENVRVWIDFDNNGSFNATTELAFISGNAKIHTGSITLPATAVLNIPLRMRVSADNFSSSVPTPCSTPQYSQVEDYRITITPNTNPPTAAFSVSNTIICSPTVIFQNLSQGGANSWQWNFGDPASGAANTSNLQNPTHTFSAPGAYTITLIACNANGCDTLTKNSYITYHTNVPIAATCTPATSSYCCGYGITNFNFGNGLIINSSANGSVGYENFACTKSATVTAGAAYPVAITGSTNPQDTRIYIDLNSDGSFTGTNEMVLEVLNTINPTGTIIIPTIATLNTPLRMRVISDQTGTNFTSCTNIQSGQAEDYTITIGPNINLPVANFRTDSTITCTGIVPFQDITTFGATSWQWDFGNPASGAANTSTLQNPTHVYPTGGVNSYTVSLIVCNSNGCDTLTKTNYVTVIPPCKTYCVSNNHSNSGQWISNVNFGNINNTSGADLNGYGNYTNSYTNMMIGTNNHSLTVAISGNTNRAINAWIDFNKDGIFQTSEKVAGKMTTLQNGIRSATIAVDIPTTVTPGPTRMRILMHTYIQNIPCANSLIPGEAEDYTVNFIPNTLPVQADFTANMNTICTGNIQFTDRSTNLPTSWQWNFGDGNTSTLQNPSHTYATTTPGMYTVTLIACKAGQCDTSYITNLVNMTVPCVNYCAVTDRNYPNNWIANVTLGTINNNSVKDPSGYGDYTHHSTDLIIGSIKNPISIDNVQASYIHVWIDFNRDRVFQANEKMPLFYGSIHPHLDSIAVPVNAVPGPTRMRIAVGGGQTPGSACAMNIFDEIEDYTVVLKPDPNLPVIGFTGTTPNYSATLPKITCNGQASFQATSNNSLTTWTWNFGDPGSGAANNTSTLANPTHTFSAPGLYTISLTGCNSNGCTTVSRVNYIKFDPTNIICNSVNLPNSSSTVTTTHCNGLLFDNGGPNGNYTGPTYSTAVINPPWAASVSLSFTAFDLHPQDFLFIHDGPSFTDPVIGMFSGNTLPKNGAPIVSSNGPLMIILDKGSGNGTAGFAAQWTCTQPTSAPIPDFEIRSSDSYCNSSMEFVNKSTNGATSYFWDFDDPFSSPYTSTLRNPTHNFNQAKVYNISLEACNSFGCNTIVKSIYVGKAALNASPLPFTCSPPIYQHRPCCGYGISNVSFNKIDNKSQLSAYLNGLEEFSCFVVDTVQAGSTYPLTVTNDTSGFNENVKAWIDYNRNGNFDANELVMNSINKTSHTAQVTIPLTATRNEHLRMRVISDDAGNTIANGCYYPVKGQIEDYSVFIVTTLPSGLASATKKLNLEIYPNPTTGKVSLKIEEAKPEKYQLEVTNLLGQVLLQKTANLASDEETQLDLTGYSKGVYFIRISNSQMSAVKKIVVE